MYIITKDDVLKRTTEVFGDAKNGMFWLESVNTALNGTTPISLLDTDEGTKTVMDILGRIEHGIFI